MSAFLFANCVKTALKIVCSAGTNRKQVVNEDESRQNDACEQKSRYDMSTHVRVWELERWCEEIVEMQSKYYRSKC